MTKFNEFTKAGKKIEESDSLVGAKMEIKEGLNIFDLVAKMMSLSSGEYFDFTFELIPVIISTLPNMKFVKKF